MRDTHDRPSAPNYTLACVVMFGVNLAWVLMTIWAIWGLIAALATSWAVNKGIDRIARTRA
jgi:hypothetical protein